ncbi:MAG TPA: PepSY-associated TM helix domain-containing protein, partial [Rhizomicrobium sp.]|nr:PepSY-associated TM helix domain-containing protein [Rhizomicrobium sp.]
EVLGSRTALLPPILTFAHQLHGNFLMGRDGRTMVVGWLGVAMLLLGISGLVLWWPRRGQWKYAFTVRSTARGVRFHRELHAATGIWIFFIFMAVSFSGVVLAWPQVMGANPPGFNPRAVPTVEATDGKRLGATEAIIAASAAVPGLSPRSVTIPARPDQTISVNYLSNGAVGATVFVDPYRGKVVSVRDPSASFMAWMRPVHQGSLGPVWQFLVFLSGLVPTLFVVTGLIMWWKKRKRHVPMSMPIAEDLEDEAAA